MKNNLPKKPAAKAVKTEPTAPKAVKKAPAAKAAKTSAKPAAAVKSAAAVKPAPAKPASVKPAATKPAAEPAKVVKTPKAAAAAKVISEKPAGAKPKKSTATAAKADKVQPVTTFVAQLEIGWGNSLYLRGEGAPELSWERGILMKWEDGSWVYSTTGAKVPVSFKFLINDQIWAEGHNQHIEPGATSITTPHFHY